MVKRSPPIMPPYRRRDRLASRSRFALEKMRLDRKKLENVNLSWGLPVGVERELTEATRTMLRQASRAGDLNPRALKSRMSYVVIRPANHRLLLKADVLLKVNLPAYFRWLEIVGEVLLKAGFDAHVEAKIRVLSLKLPSPNEARQQILALDRDMPWSLADLLPALRKYRALHRRPDHPQALECNLFIGV